MIAEIQAGFAGAKAAYDVAKGIHSLATEADRNLAVIDIQRYVVEAQHGLIAAQDAIRVAHETIAALDAKLANRAEARNKLLGYKLAKHWPDSLVLAWMDEPAHFACVNCAANDIVSVLQPTGARERRYGIYRCQTCKQELPVGEPKTTPDPTQAPVTVEVRSDYDPFERN